MHWCAHHTISIAMILKRPNKWYVPTASPHRLFMHMVICENNSCPNNYCHITNLYWYLYSISIYLECVLHVPPLCLSNRQYQWLTPIFWVSYDRCEHPDLGACELTAQRSVEPEQSSTGNPPTLSDTRFCAISLRVTCFACVTCLGNYFRARDDMRPPAPADAALCCPERLVLRSTPCPCYCYAVRNALWLVPVCNVCAVLRPPSLYSTHHSRHCWCIRAVGSLSEAITYVCIHCIH